MIEMFIAFYCALIAYKWATSPSKEAEEFDYPKNKIKYKETDRFSLMNEHTQYLIKKEMANKKQSC